MTTTIRKVANYLRRNTGILYNPLLQSSVRCGALVDVDRRLDVDWRGTLWELGVAEVPEEASDARPPRLDRIRGFDFKGNAKADLQQGIGLGADVAFDNASKVSMQFGDTSVFRLSWVRLERAIFEALEQPQVEGFLKRKGMHIVVGTYVAPVRVVFERQGEAGFDFRVKAARAGEVQLAAGWNWKSGSVAQSETPVVFGFETARWHFTKRRLVETLAG